MKKECMCTMQEVKMTPIFTAGATGFLTSMALSPPFPPFSTPPSLLSPELFFNTTCFDPAP